MKPTSPSHWPRPELDRRLAMAGRTRMKQTYYNWLHCPATNTSTIQKPGRPGLVSNTPLLLNCLWISSLQARRLHEAGPSTSTTYSETTKVRTLRYAAVTHSHIENQVNHDTCYTSTQPGSKVTTRCRIESESGVHLEFLMWITKVRR